jgi:hypothetical protein
MLEVIKKAKKLKNKNNDCLNRKDTARIQELTLDMERIRYLFSQSNNNKYKEGLNKLMYLLIVNLHRVERPKISEQEIYDL